MRPRLRLLLLSIALIPLAQAAQPNASSIHRDTDGIRLVLPDGSLELRVFSPRVIEVIHAPRAALPKTKSFSVIAKPGRTPWNLAETGDELTLSTSDLTVHVNRTSGAVSFVDRSGETVLAEEPSGGSLFTPAHVGTIDTLHSRQTFVLQPGEALYGLGQHPDSPMNYRGTKVHLQQENRDVAVPVLM